MTPPTKRQELGEFLKQTGTWRILGIISSPDMGDIFDMVMVNSMSVSPRQKFWRIHAIQTADFTIRRFNPAIMAGGPEIRFSTDDPRLSDRGLQYVPGSDYEEYNPPRRYQLLELDRSWIIAVRFEIEPLPQTSVG
jgi:hypothetical protein